MHTPSVCPPVQADKDDLPTPAGHDKDEAVNSPDQEGSVADTEPQPEDEEEEEEQEKPEEPAPAAAPAKPPAPADSAAPTKPARREKTPSEKAAHARYMRFSRSLTSFLAAITSLMKLLYACMHACMCIRYLTFLYAYVCNAIALFADIYWQCWSNRSQWNETTLLQLDRSTTPHLSRSIYKDYIDPAAHLCYLAFMQNV